jgi:phosphoenolpyruvate phosphomutase
MMIGSGSSLAPLLESPDMARIVGARDPLTAILAEQAGFDGVWVSSLETSATRGLPDLGLLTMSECLAQAIEISKAVSIPSLVDCDTGYGGRINVRRTVREFVAADAAGICLEDKLFPKRNSFLDGTQALMPCEEFAQVIETAVGERGSHPLTVVARLESFVAGEGIDRVLERAHAYADSGADAILVHSKSSRPDDVAGFLAKWDRRLPVIVIPTTYHDWTATQARDAGASAVIYANHGLRACVAALRSTFARILQDDCTAHVDADIASVAEVLALTRTAEWEGRP